MKGRDLSFICRRGREGQPRPILALLSGKRLSRRRSFHILRGGDHSLFLRGGKPKKFGEEDGGPLCISSSPDPFIEKENNLGVRRGGAPTSPKKDISRKEATLWSTPAEEETPPFRKGKKKMDVGSCPAGGRRSGPPWDRQGGYSSSQKGEGGRKKSHLAFSRRRKITGTTANSSAIWGGSFCFSPAKNVGFLLVRRGGRCRLFIPRVWKSAFLWKNKEVP